MKNQIILCGKKAALAMDQGLIAVHVHGDETVKPLNTVVLGLAMAKALSKDSCKTRVVIDHQEMVEELGDLASPALVEIMVQEFLKGLSRVTPLMIRHPDLTKPNDTGGTEASTVTGYLDAAAALTAKINTAIAPINKVNANKKHINGRPYFGYVIKDGAMVPDPKNAPAIKAIFDLLDKGIAGKHLIAALKVQVFKGKRKRWLQPREIYRIQSRADLYRRGIYVNPLGDSTQDDVLILAPMGKP